jgi:hypothetical protein
MSDKIDFRKKLARKIKVEFPETTDYRFWARFNKEGAPKPLMIKAWAPVFMLVVLSLIGLSIYHNPETNQHMLTLQTDRSIETEQEMLNWVLVMDEENEEFFAMSFEEVTPWYDLEELN